MNNITSLHPYPHYIRGGGGGGGWTASLHNPIPQTMNKLCAGALEEVEGQLSPLLSKNHFCFSFKLAERTLLDRSQDQCPKLFL